eukprot:COSAG05_NODE_502_length_9214_cov_3.816676_8_plen_67_part_00
MTTTTMMMMRAVVGYGSSGTIRSRDTAGIPFGAVSELGVGGRLAGGGDAMAAVSNGLIAIGIGFLL